ncbi:MAG: transcription antitermination factor NusB [Alistipes sp.]|nr:transcription antitermination factor NusB [Candidatus Alistipes equi]
MISRRVLREKVVKEVYACIQNRKDDRKSAEKELVHAIDRAYHIYIMMLSILPEIQRHAEMVVDNHLHKMIPTEEDLHPNLRFVQNRIIRSLSTSENIAKAMKQYRLSWGGSEDLIRILYQKLTESELYTSYMNNPQEISEKDFVKKVYMEFLQYSLDLEEYLESKSIFWIDDLGYALLMAARTATTCKANQDFSLMEEFTEADDLSFAKRLFLKAIESYEQSRVIMKEFSENWDVERIALMDSVILSVAMAELKNFPEIPVKVTLNEYIDIAKNYSGERSSTFVNGMLDKFVAKFSKEGVILKSRVNQKA